METPLQRLVAETPRLLLAVSGSRASARSSKRRGCRIEGYDGGEAAIVSQRRPWRPPCALAYVKALEAAGFALARLFGSG
jgi:hypothetical protein